MPLNAGQATSHWGGVGEAQPRQIGHAACVTIGDEAIAAVERHPAVRRVRLVGSRAIGTPTALSDWDFAVETDHFEDVARDVESLLAPLRPLAQQWDRLSETWCWMAILRGPVKLDLIFAEAHEKEAPWRPDAANLTAIDCHFWDWMLWLASKRTGGENALVRSELDELWLNILLPVGVDSRPVALDDVVVDYLAARDRLERKFRVGVPRTLEDEVRPLLGADQGSP
jgi:predicted nucleotidyltransferase